MSMPNEGEPVMYQSKIVNKDSDLKKNSILPDIRSDNRGMEAFRMLRASAKENGIQDMDTREINEEIKLVREGN